ncbi:MAG TPA: dinitrogenase iron-molybdenum cofactor biosynthesis protein, partial [bacterium]|nr:dinitrogenase iron-molybdenum cofactor biosynthesis protein [bacterium]
SFVAGDVNEVIQAWLSGKLGTDTYAMPGCGCQRGGRGWGSGGWRGGNARGAVGAESGTAFLQDNGQQECICPACGYRAPHQRGVPCSRLRCPQCGAALRRGFS